MDADADVDAQVDVDVCVDVCEDVNEHPLCVFSSNPIRITYLQIKCQVLMVFRAVWRDTGFFTSERVFSRGRHIGHNL